MYIHYLTNKNLYKDYTIKKKDHIHETAFIMVSFMATKLVALSSITFDSFFPEPSPFSKDSIVKLRKSRSSHNCFTCFVSLSVGVCLLNELTINEVC